MIQAIISSFSGTLPICISLQQETTTQQLKQQIFDLTRIPVNQQVLRTVGGFNLNNEHLFEDKDVHLSLSGKLLGGKGGFGSMLRAQGGRMNAQKTTNFEACRDLQGRRIRTVNEAKRLQEELESVPERDAEKRENLKRKIDKALKEKEPKKHLFDDNKFLEDTEEMVENVKSAVGDAIKRQKTSHTSSVATTSKGIFDDDISSSEEDDNDDDEDDSDNEKEQVVVAVKDIKGKGKNKS